MIIVNDVTCMREYVITCVVIQFSDTRLYMIFGNTHVHCTFAVEKRRTSSLETSLPSGTSRKISARTMG